MRFRRKRAQLFQSLTEPYTDCIQTQITFIVAFPCKALREIVHIKKERKATSLILLSKNLNFPQSCSYMSKVTLTHSMAFPGPKKFFCMSFKRKYGIFGDFKYPLLLKMENPLRNVSSDSKAGEIAQLHVFSQGLDMGYLPLIRR